MSNEQTASGAHVPCISLLAARDAAIEKVVKDCGGDDAPDNERLRVAFVMVAREAAGRGFDEGVRFIAANDAALLRQATSDLEVSQRREKMWRDECTRIVNALADLAGLPRDPCPGWQPCVEKIKFMMANKVLSK
jgi:hypothetical protein